MRRAHHRHARRVPDGPAATKGGSWSPRKHDNPEIERVVYQTDRFWIVEKHPDLS
jgi:hypothetical protein